MIASSRSFRSIIEDSEPLLQRLQGDYWAHIDGRKGTVETLFEHSRLVADYLIKIIEAHGIERIADSIIERLSRSIFPDRPDLGNDYIKSLFVSSIFLHDLGKVNPNFQAKRMKNPQFRPEKLRVEHQHSFPGAYIYCVYHFQKIFSDPSIDEDRDRNLLAFMVMSLSNPIIRHHSSYIDFYDSFNTEEILRECSAFLEQYQINAGEDLRTAIFSYVEEIRNCFNEKSNEASKFCLYTLIKLAYSLLTASDFYATNEFMADMPVSNLGLIDHELRKKIKETFWSEKPYNKDLFQNFNYYTSKPFAHLQGRSNDDLNILRQKLTAEVVHTLRKYPDNYWYYIEAPTGSGKTNLSLAFVAEMLDKDRSLNKVFYVFPFTTLITQTSEGIKDTLKLTNEDVIQLHSKTGLHSRTKKEDGDARYGEERTLYLDHLFVNYPFVLTSHVKFFEIIKGNSKETNYVFHRLCNSIVVIDELQSYNPKHWDKIIYFVEHYAQLLNIRFVIMSATLPKIDQMSPTAEGKFISLTPNKDQYFNNPNFSNRVSFDFSLIDELKSLKDRKENYLSALAGKIKDTADRYALTNNGKVRVLVEFITKNTAAKFFNQILQDGKFDDFKIYIISGDILEPRRREVLKKIKLNSDEKVILVSTQVIEAGVDIDMDIGFKNRAILDSDEQMAGRINRNAAKSDCKVFLFELDSIKTIYGRDERYKQQTSDKYFEENWREILVQKKFHELYKKVFEERRKSDWTEADRFPAYLNNFNRLDFRAIDTDFKLIEDDESQTIFIPLDIHIPNEFDGTETLVELDVLTAEGKISGEKVFQRLIEIFTKKTSRVDFFTKKIDLRKIAGLTALFTINLYPKAIRALHARFDPEKEKYGFKYLLHHSVYTYENGFDMSKVSEDIFL